MKYFLLSFYFFGIVILSAFEKSFGQNISINTTGAANSTNSMLEVLGIATALNGSGLYVSQSATVTNVIYGFSLYNTSTSGTASINKYGMDIQSTGTWNGASANNIGLQITATGGTNNYALIVPASSGIVGIGTVSPTANFLATFLTNATTQRAIDITLTGGSGNGVNVTSASSEYNNIVSTNSGNATATYYTVGGHLTSVVAPVSGYLGYHTGTGNLAANYFAGYFNGKTAITSNTSPDGIADLEVQNTTSGAGNPSTVFLRQTTSLTTTGNILSNLNFGDNHSTFPQAQIQIIRGAAGGAGDLPTDMLFYTAPNGSATLTEKMRIDNTGNVGIGTTAPSEKLEVCGNVKVIGTINASGSITASQAIMCSSDIRYKKNITPITNTLANVMKLKGVNYFFKKEEFIDKSFNGKKQIGFIAQDLEKIYPEIVMTDNDGYKSVDYSRLTPILVEAIKEQQSMIEKQKQNDLQNKIEIEELKKQITILQLQVKQVNTILHLGEASKEKR